MSSHARLPSFLVALAAALALALPGAAFAQKKKKAPPEEKQPDADGDDADGDDADGEAPEEELTPEEKQKAAVEAYKAGKAHQDAEEWDEAIAKYEEAYELFTDANLLLAIGEVYRLKGSEATEVKDFIANLKKAVEYYERYLEAVPEGESEALDQQRTAAQERVDTLNEAITKAEEEEEARLAEEQKRKEEEERREREEREALLAQQKEREGMQLALDGLLVAGVEDDLTGIGRLIAGGFVGWGVFAIEAHLSFDAFLRLDNAQGVSGRSVTVADIGGRVSFDNNRFTGPFVSAGAGYGFFSGSPRERKLDGDMETCADFENQDGEFNCSFDVDRNLSTRFGFGYGFEANKKTTVAVRLDLSYWFYSVDGKQPTGSPRAINVEKPQGGPSVFVGLEFMRWK